MNKIDLTNRRVVIRSYGAGVHFGTFLHKEGREVHLKNARRLWSWQGALSLHEVAGKGPNVSQSKISEPLEEVIVLEVIEVLPIQKGNTLPC